MVIFPASFALSAKFGANKICALMWMYGPPPNVKALLGFFQMQMEQERWQDYMADMSWGLIKAIRPKFSGKMYSTIKRSSNVQDSRTGKEIVQDLAKEFRKRKAAREVKKQNEIV